LSDVEAPPETFLAEPFADGVHKAGDVRGQ
jgi:hypothetical protein